MRVLTDTNIVIRMAVSNHPDRGLVGNATDALSGQGHELCIVPQVLYELWAVATRPKAQNGLGCSVPRAVEVMEMVRSACTLLPDPPDLVDRWQALVVEHSAKGKSAHDARLVAAMEAHAIRCLLTSNTAHFRRYTKVILIAPHDLKE